MPDKRLLGLLGALALLAHAFGLRLLLLDNGALLLDFFNAASLLAAAVIALTLLASLHAVALALAHFPRYLDAMALRAERALRDPAKDQARMLELTPFVQALDAARATPAFADPRWQALRWELEELRVSLFAQELGTAIPVSAKRLARQRELLRAGAAQP